MNDDTTLIESPGAVWPEDDQQATTTVAEPQDRERLMEQGVVTLPVHDAVVVRKANGVVAERVMEEAFKERTGVDGVVEKEG